MTTSRTDAARLDALTERLDALEASVNYLSQALRPALAVPTVAELEGAHSRADLDDLARKLGVERPDALPSKRVVAEHIVEAIHEAGGTLQAADGVTA